MKRLTIYFGMLTIGILALAIPAAVYLSQQQQTLTTKAQVAGDAQIAGKVVDRDDVNKAIDGVVVKVYSKNPSGNLIEKGVAITANGGTYTIGNLLRCQGCSYIVSTTYVPDDYFKAADRPINIVQITQPPITFELRKKNPTPPGNAGNGATNSTTNNTSGVTKGPKLPAPQSCARAELTIDDTKFGGQGSPITIPNPLCLSGIGGVRRFVILTFDLLMVFVTLASFFMLIWGGVQYITSGGDPKAAGSAKARITYAIIGLAVVGLSLVIFMIISRVLGFSIITGQDRLGDAVSQEVDKVVEYCGDPANTRGRMTYDNCVLERCASYEIRGSVSYKDCVRLANGPQLP